MFESRKANGEYLERRNHRFAWRWILNPVGEKIGRQNPKDVFPSEL